MVEKSPIAGTFVTPLFSPAGTTHPNAEVRFRLRTRERLTVWIQSSDGKRVTTLLLPRTAHRGQRFDLVWDGFSRSGTIQPDGNYYPVVKLLRSHRTIVLPSRMVLDTKPPTIRVKHPQYPILSPDSLEKSKAVWCSADRGKAWIDMMVRDALPKSDTKCDTPIDKVLAYGQSKKVNGTPTMFFEDGERVPGVMPIAEVEKKLALGKNPSPEKTASSK